MQKVYSHENPFQVSNLKQLLEQQGIDCLLRNDQLRSGAGELAPGDVWPELWVLDDSRKAEAITIIDKVELADDTDTWICNECGESNHASFEHCWKCRNEPRL